MRNDHAPHAADASDTHCGAVGTVGEEPPERCGREWRGTPVNEARFIRRLGGLRNSFAAGHTRPVEWRRQQLRALRRMLEERYCAFAEALATDLHKSEFETYATELGFVIEEIDHAMEHLTEWVRPAQVHTPQFAQPATSAVVHEPLGVVLIMGPWNYPLHLTLAPLVAAIAAGNAAVLKPPRTTRATCAAVAQFVPQYLDSRAICVATGDVPNELILGQRWDMVFFTGSARVGRIVLQAAAKRLTPVTLELGGKSPTLVDRSANLQVAARRVVSGKFLNAGQTCVAPDYVLVHTQIAEQFIAQMADEVRLFFGPRPQQSPDYSRIIDTEHFDRLVRFLDDGRIVVGGQTDRVDRYIAPTILRDVANDAGVMQEEIFGPILPVLEIDTIDDGIDFINRRDRPLALYVFAEDRGVVDAAVSKTSSGGVCVNDCAYQLAVHDLPFGGVGPSGMGKYHGEWGFRSFSNAKAVLDRETSFDPDLRYPPYDEAKIEKLKRLMERDVRLPGLLGGAATGLLRYVLRNWGNRLLGS